MTTSTSNTSELHQLLEYGRIQLDRQFNLSEFAALTSRFPDWQMELDAQGKVWIMSPVKKETGRYEAILIGLVYNWAIQHGGDVYSSATGIELPNESVYCPDCAWVSPERNRPSEKNTSESGFLKVVPNFVAEIRSESDRLSILKEKMESVWLAAGVELAWLIDPIDQRVSIYRPDTAIQIQAFSEGRLSGAPDLPGLLIDLNLFVPK